MIIIRKRFDVMDFSYLCPQRGMVGEAGLAIFAVNGGLNEESMLQDSAKWKKTLKHVIDEYSDHKLVVPAGHRATQLASIDERPHGDVQVAFA